MDKLKIEAVARDLQIKIWRERSHIWPAGTLRLADLLDPAIAAAVLGINFEEYDELGRFGDGKQRYEIAGLIDRQANKIAVSRKFPPETMRFTGAHELGHWLMHSKEVMHRDRPIKGLSSDGAARSPREQEADYFAACFLIPKKPLVAAFELAFKTKTPFVFNDTSAFWLCGTDPDSLLRADSSSLDRALALASAEHYAGTHFISLAKQFRVSITSMAIRLKELKLLEE